MSLCVATFNVKNLLTPDTDAARAVLPAKLDFLAEAIGALDADVVGLQEVGPSELVDALGERLEGRYRAPVLGTADARGIRCALLSRLPCLAATVHTASSLAFPPFFAGDPAPFGTRIPLRRGVVHARVDAPDIGPVDFLVVHFKSPRPVPLRDASGAELAPATARERAEGVLRGLVWRAAEALYVRGLVDEVRAADEAACVAVLGDMNDTPDSIVLRTLRGDGDGELFDCSTPVDPASRFTLVHEGRRMQLDHVLATSALHRRLRRAWIRNEGLREHGPASAGCEEVPTVDSDHAPVVVRFG